MQKKITRSSNDKMLGGVCAGIADYFGIDVTWVRLAFFALALLKGGGVMLYLLMWIIIPEADSLEDEIWN